MKSPFLKNGAENMRFKFYADKTINAYTYWIKSASTLTINDNSWDQILPLRSLLRESERKWGSLNR